MHSLIVAPFWWLPLTAVVSCWLLLPQVLLQYTQRCGVRFGYKEKIYLMTYLLFFSSFHLQNQRRRVRSPIRNSLSEGMILSKDVTFCFWGLDQGGAWLFGAIHCWGKLPALAFLPPGSLPLCFTSFVSHSEVPKTDSQGYYQVYPVILSLSQVCKK